MKKYVIGLIGILFWGQNGFSQNDITIFTSDFEKQLFQNHLNDSSKNSIEWFLAIEYEPEYHVFIDRYQQFIQTLKKEIEKYPVKKKIKTIYKSVRAGFLKTYSEECLMKDAFFNGNYNNVEASALYAMILSDLNIPYSINGKTDHFYVIADPDNTNFRIETPLVNNDPVNITQDKSISIKQLAGIQYYNKGMVLNRKKKYTEALKNFEKAVLLYPAEYIRHMKNNTLLSAISEELTTKNYQGKNLGKYLLLNHGNSGVVAGCLDHFKEITNELAVNHPDMVTYDVYFSDFKKFTDTIAINDFTRVYYYYKGQYLSTHNKYKDALQCLAIAYHANPDDVNTRKLIIDIFRNTLINQKLPLESFNVIEAEYNTFPFLESEKKLREILIMYYASASAKYFYTNNPVTGNSYLKKMETVIKAHNDIDKAFENVIFQIYNQLATDFYVRGNYVGALKTLERGLSIYPNSSVLSNRHKSIADYKPEAARIAKSIKYDDSTIYGDGQIVIPTIKDSLNVGVSKFLHGKWKMIVNANVRTVGVPNQNEGIMVTFKLNHVLVFHESTSVQVVGKWEYNTETCVLHIEEAKNHISFNIIIVNIKENQIKGVMIVDDRLDRATEMVFIKEYGLYH